MIKAQPNAMWRRIHLWNQLAAEGKHELISTLADVEQRTPGFGTIVVPRDGFSDNDETHNAVIEFIRDDVGARTLNPSLEIYKLEQALHPGGYS